MKKLIALLLVLALALSLVACGGSEPASGGEEEAVMIGVSMPTKSLQRWNQDGDYMKAMLEEAGYQVDLQYGGDNDIPHR
jgi:putative multiple sugar transport system substrate-binding protein